MITSDMANRLFYLGTVQMRLRREIGIKEVEIKALKRELKETEKEMFALRSTKEYEEYARKEIIK